MTRLRESRNAKEAAIAAAESERGELTALLQSHGALDQFHQLNREVTEIYGQFQVVVDRIQELKDAREAKRQIVHESKT